MWPAAIPSWRVARVSADRITRCRQACLDGSRSQTGCSGAVIGGTLATFTETDTGVIGWARDTGMPPEGDGIRYLGHVLQPEPDDLVAELADRRRGSQHPRIAVRAAAGQD
jgi:hypothetical protein